MALGRFLRPDQASDDRSGAGETATVRRIVARLEALPRDRARFLAGFAYVMSRAAEADFDISDAETKVMERYVVELGGIDEAQAVLVVQMAKDRKSTRLNFSHGYISY